MRINTEDVVVIGDLHGNWNTLKNFIRNLNNTSVIVAGDCGFGFEKKEYYIHFYKSIKNTLNENNVYIYFIRGNHDDPAYFTGDVEIGDRFILVPDYTVLEHNNNRILCIGGAVSVDKFYRKINIDWWENEGFIFDETKCPSEPITHIITHTFLPFTVLCGMSIDMFLKLDNTLQGRLDLERENLLKLINWIKEKNLVIKKWYFGHYHTDLSFLYKGIKCECIMDVTNNSKLSYLILK